MSVLSDEEIEQRLAGLPGWERASVAGKPGIQKVFMTGSFLAGLGLLTRVAVLAEAANHHPDVMLTFSRLTIQLTTHCDGGPTRRDFDLAARINALNLA